MVEKALSQLQQSFSEHHLVNSVVSSGENRNKTTITVEQSSPARRLTITSDAATSQIVTQVLDRNGASGVILPSDRYHAGEVTPLETTPENERNLLKLGVEMVSYAIGKGEFLQHTEAGIMQICAALNSRR